MSSVLTPIAPDRDGWLARRNPVAKLSAAVIVLVGVVVDDDVRTSGLILLFLLLGLPFSGVRIAALLQRLWLLLLSVGGITLTNLLVVDGGKVLLDLGVADVSRRGLDAAAAIALRLLAITLPGIVVLATTDPLDAADALVQRWRVSPRFAYGTLAALRLLPLLAADWHTIGRAHRARGLDAGRSPVAMLRLFGQQTFGVLVGAIRRGVRLAAAMDARGFDVQAPRQARTVARPQPMRPADWLLLATTVALVAAAAVA